MNIIIFVIILLVLVLVHEFGHFFTAKRFGIRVDEFGFGFPPKLFGFKKGETEYTFNLLPLGGFVKIFGENGDEVNASDQDYSRSFVNKAKWKRALVLVAGIVSNFLLAWLLFSVGFMFGLPTSVGSEQGNTKLQNVNLVITSVLVKSPAESAGLKIGDKIISVTTKPESSNPGDYLTHLNPKELQEFIITHGDDNEMGLTIDYQRADERNLALVKPVLIDGKPMIGISMDQIGIEKLPFFSALVEGAKLDWFMAKSTVTGLYTLIKDGLNGKDALSAITGPIGMVGIIGDASKFGFVYLLSFAALISINLAVINLLPFPALDGGQLFFLLIEKIKGSRLNQKVVNTVNMIGFSLLIFLMLLVTYHDIIKLF
jgi:regulator of sigma E protease